MNFKPKAGLGKVILVLAVADYDLVGLLVRDDRQPDLVLRITGVVSG